MSSLEEEIDKFRFEEEAIVISKAEEETDEYLCVQTPAFIITYVEDCSDNEEEEMAPKTGLSMFYTKGKTFLFCHIDYTIGFRGRGLG